MAERFGLGRTGHAGAHRTPAGAASRRPYLDRLRGGVLARQVGTDQFDLLCRIRSARAAFVGRSDHDVPDRTDVRPGPARVGAPAADRDTDGRRLGGRTARSPRRVARNPGSPRRCRQRDQRFCRGPRYPACAGGRSRRAGSVRRGRRRFADQARCDGRGRDPALAPCHRQHSRSPARDGTGRHRHPRAERDRQRARAHAESHSERRCGAVRAGRRCGRHPHRHRSLAREHQSFAQVGPIRGAQQDRRFVGRIARRGADRARDRRAGRIGFPDAGRAAGADLPGFCAEGAGRQDPGRSRAAAQEPAG